MEIFRWKPLLLGLLNFAIAGCGENPLPILEIHSEQSITSTEKSPCLLTYRDISNHFLVPAKIRRRGGYSMRFKKHSWSIQLDYKLPLAQLPTDDDWILNANYIDKTFMRHKISYDLFRLMNPENKAPRTAYVRVFLNEKYQGLYLISEKLDASTLSLNKASTEACIFKDPPVFFKDSLLAVQDPLNYYHQKFPDLKKTDRTKALRDFKSFLFEARDSQFRKEISEMVHIKQVVDWHILLLFTNNSDGIMKNFFLFKDGRDPRFQIAIWDYDHSFGRDGDNERNLMERELDCSRSILLKRLLETNPDGYRQKLYLRWQELQKKNILTPARFQQLVLENRRLIEAEIPRNARLWPTDSKDYYDTNTFSQELALMDTFVQMRVPFLEHYLRNLAKDDTFLHH